MTHLDTELVDIALGKTPSEELGRAEAHLATCARCRAELAAIGEATAVMALQLPPLSPPPGLRARLLDSAAAPGRRALVDLMARVFDLAPRAAGAVLDSADDKEQWGPGPVDGMNLIHFDAGPRVAGADTGLLRFAPGVQFPRHTHAGLEIMLVLEGGFIDDRGTSYGPGARLHQLPGSSHSFTCDRTEGLLAAVVVYEGIEIDGYGWVSAAKRQ
jgi:putative transcriptional regulator